MGYDHPDRHHRFGSHYGGILVLRIHDMLGLALIFYGAFCFGFAFTLANPLERAQVFILAQIFLPLGFVVYNALRILAFLATIYEKHDENPGEDKIDKAMKGK